MKNIWNVIKRGFKQCHMYCILAGMFIPIAAEKFISGDCGQGIIAALVVLASWLVAALCGDCND